jgi:hypothetical protein
LIGGDAGPAHRHHPRSLGELLEAPAARRRHAREIQGGERGVGGALGAGRVELGDLLAADQHDREQPPLAACQRGGLRARRPRQLLRRHGERPLIERREGEGNGRGVARAQRRILGQELRHQKRERRGDLGPEAPDVGYLVEEDLGEQRHDVVAGERAHAGEALEEHAAEHEQVGPGIDLLPGASLLGRHVARRAHQDPARGHPAQAAEPRDAEVEDLDPAHIPFGEEEVTGLEIAVDDPALVRRRERLGGAHADRHCVGHVEHPPLEAAPEILPGEPLHHQVGVILRRHPVVDVAHDPRVVELCERRDLAIEALPVGHAAAAQHLDGHGLARALVPGLVDLAHPAGAGEPLQREAPAQLVSDVHTASIGYRRRARPAGRGARGFGRSRPSLFAERRS